MIRRRLLFVIALPLVLSGCPPLSPNVALTKNLVYGSGRVMDGSGMPVLRDLRFDLIEPRDGSPRNRPAAVLIHGGSFVSGSKENPELVQYADGLARAGYVCFLINYRLLGEPPPAPPSFELDETAMGEPVPEELEAAIHAAFVDAKTALRHVRANAGRYGVDPDRIAVMGASAGAFAAVAAGVTEPEAFASDGPGFPVPPENNPETDPAPNAVIDFWGNGDIVLDDFSRGDPPMLIVHGVIDRQFGTPFDGARRMRNACLVNGIRHWFVSLPAEGHGAWDARPGGQSLAALSIDFLDTFLR